MKLNLTDNESLVFGHVGEVVLVYDSKYNLIWYHPNPDMHGKDEYDIAVNVSICEDMTIWGQVQFDEPYNAFMYNIYNQNFTCTYSHDCGIRPAPDYGFDT